MVDGSCSPSGLDAVHATDGSRTVCFVAACETVPSAASTATIQQRIAIVLSFIT